MPYGETIIEDFPLDWLEFYFGFGFPNYQQFRPTYPKWWEGMTALCRNEGCGQRYRLQDVKVDDPFVNETTCRGSEYYVRHSCISCGFKNLTRIMLVDVLKDQILEHIKKHTTKQTEQ